MAIENLNVTAAALLTQFFLLVVLAIGIALQPTEPFYRASGDDPSWVMFAALALLTIGPLVLSRDLSGQSSPLLRGINIGILEPGTARAITFFLDCIGLAIINELNAGLRSSPFGSAILALPALAIFLREPFSHVAWYVGIISISALIAGLRAQGRGGAAFAFVTVAVLVLTTAVAYITRP